MQVIKIRGINFDWQIKKKTKEERRSGNLHTFKIKKKHISIIILLFDIY